MVYKCPNCGADLEYSVELNKMVCRFCESSFEVSEMNDSLKKAPEKSSIQDGPIIKQPVGMDKLFGADYDASQIGDYNTLLKRKETEQEEMRARSRASLSMQIMKCTSCGGELAINGVESSTFCAYCGQATVIMDRMENFLEPDYIIPFKINKADAESIIRNRMKDGFFIPKEIKEFQVEKLRGIYIPFWLVDVEYDDRQYYKYTVKSGKSRVTRYAFRAGDCSFKKLTVDASKKLNDNSSTRLEPYDMRQLKDFEAQYMAGYYADRFDMGIDDSKPTARAKAGMLFDEAMKETVKHADAKLVSKMPRVDFKDAKYAMLPAWFLTFKHDHQQYTILVNGQTGKMVGAFPFDKKKATAIFSALSVGLSALIVPIGIGLSNYFINYVGFSERISIMYLIGIPVLAGVIWTSAFRIYKRMKESISLTRDSDINEFVKERQGR